MNHPLYQDALNSRELADLLGCTEQHIRQSYKERGIPYIRCAGRVIYLEREIRTWLLKQANRLPTEEATL